MPFSYYRHLRQLGLLASEASSFLKISLGLAMAALGGFFFIRFVRSSSSN